MTGENGTFFTKTNCIDGHFIIVGAEDRSCNDLLQITSMEYELSEHLRNHGFEAVVFFDPVRMTYCYDAESAYFIRHNRLRGSAAADNLSQQDPSQDDVSADGPLARFRRRRHNEQQHVENEEDIPFWTGALSIDDVYERLRLMLTQTRVRCAVVFSNMDFSGPDSGGLLSCLEQLSGRSIGEENIAVYMMRESALCQVKSMIAETNGAYGRFLRNVIEPRINATDPYHMRVIFLPRPNAHEIRNLINRLRLIGSSLPDNVMPGREERIYLNVETADIDKLAFRLADECGQKKWSLVNLSEILMNDTRSHSEPLSINNWQRIAPRDVSPYLTAADELNAMIGLDEFKQSFAERMAASEYFSGGNFHIPVHASRFSPPEQSAAIHGSFDLNIVLSGDPGTGKSTVAGLIARMYHELGLLSKGHTVNRAPGALLGVNEAITAEKVHEAVLEAIGGVLFIDEIYTWVDGDRGSTGLGQAAINQLTLDMSVYAGQLAFVIAGYKQRMNDFFRANQGLASRFPASSRFELSPYTGDQLNQIFHLQINRRNIDIPPEIERILPEFFKKWSQDKTTISDDAEAWGNAREVEGLTAAIDSNLAARYGKTQDFSERRTLKKEDFPKKLRDYLEAGEDTLESIQNEIRGMTGLDGIKKYFETLIQNIIYAPQNGKPPEPGRYIFMGPPGTGKTEVRKLLARLLWRLNLIKRRVPETVKAKDLVNGTNEEGIRTDLSAVLRRARGGMLFIDEAHQLLESAEGRRVITQLVPIVEDPEIRADTAFVLAGYTVEMETLLEQDAGLASRFPMSSRILFQSYSADELTDILEQFIYRSGQKTDDERDDKGNRIPGGDGFLNRTLVAMDHFLEKNTDENFGNGRFMREDYLSAATAMRSKRLHQVFGPRGKQALDAEKNFACGGVDEELKITFTKDDLPAFAARLFSANDLTLKRKTPEDSLNELISKDDLIRYANAMRESLDRPSSSVDQSSFSTGFVYAITGPIGCGKETAVRTFVKYLHSIGLLERDACFFAGKGDMEGEYVGHSVQKTRRLVNRCKKGGLAIVSPISMTDSGSHENSFGPEAMGALIGEIAKERFSTAFFLIDTKENMESVYRSFPQLQGLVQRTFDFEDLLPADIEKLFRLATQNKLAFSPELEKLLPDFFVNWTSDRGGHSENPAAWANGDEVTKLISTLETNWELSDNGTKEINGMECKYITQQEFPEELQHYLKKTSVISDEALRNMQNLIGMKGVKEAINNVRLHVSRGNNVMPGVYAFLGNPGTGKTMMAGYMGAALKAAGALKHGHVIARTARELDGHPEAWDYLIRLAKNGVLFIDEAYLLSTSVGGMQIIEKLLTTVENNRIMKDLCIIVAGYEWAMERQFFKANAGLFSRFGTSDSKIYFDDYNAEELVEILRIFAANAPKEPRISSRHPLELSQGFMDDSRQIFEAIIRQRNPDFGNARFVRNYLVDCYDRQLHRIEAEEARGYYGDEFTLTETDIPENYRGMIAEQKKRRDKLLCSNHFTTELFPGTLALSESEWLDQIDAATVFILIYENGRLLGSGSGCIISQNGIVLTCNHVVLDENGIYSPDRIFKIRVNTPGAVGGETHTFDCELLHQGHSGFDMALLKIKGDNFRYVPLAEEDADLQRLEEVLVKGYPLGRNLTGGDVDAVKSSDFKGSLSSIQRYAGFDRYYIDCSGKEGNSGSPVFSMKTRKLVGVFSGSIGHKSKDLTEEINYFYPIRYFWPFFTRRELPGRSGGADRDIPNAGAKDPPEPQQEGDNQTTDNKE